MYTTTTTIHSFFARCPILAVTLLVAGCAHHAGSVAVAESDGVSVVQPEDIAVPKGMKLLEDNHISHTRESGSFRYADLTYEGNVPVVQVASYLLASMPLRDYRLESKTSPAKDHEQLRFRRGPYVLDCSIQRHQDPPVTRLVYKLRTHIKPE